MGKACLVKSLPKGRLSNPTSTQKTACSSNMRLSKKYRLKSTPAFRFQDVSGNLGEMPKGKDLKR